MTNQENVNWQFIFFFDKYKLLFKKQNKTDVCFRPVTRFDRKNSVISCGVDCTSRPRISRSDALPQNSIVS